MVSTIARIKKRDGTVIDFTQDKITTAVHKAMRARASKTGPPPRRSPTSSPS